MLPAGTYRARAVDSELGYTSTDKEQVVVEFSILDEPHVGEHISWYGYFTDGTRDRTIESLRHCGWQGEDINNLAGIDLNEVQLVVEHDEYEGRPSAKVRWVNKAGGIVLKKRMSPEDAKRFAARLRPHIVANAAKAGARPPSAPKAAPKPQPAQAGDALADDEVPF